MRTAIIGAIVTLLCPSARADQPGSSKIEMCVSGEGMAGEVLKATRNHFTQQLKSLKVEFVAPPRVGNCCIAPECLGEEAVQRGAQGILIVEMVRFGPMVRATFYLFDAITKKQILLAKGTASARKFPTASAFIPDLTRCLDVLRKHARTHHVEPPLKVQKPRVLKPRPPKPRVVHKPPDPVSAHSVAPASRSGTAWYWLGGSLIAGGASLTAVGVYFLVGPMSQAQERRDQSDALWAAAFEQADIDRYYAEILAHDDQAQKYHLLGWIGVGLGTALLAGGAMALILRPEDPPTQAAEVLLRPYLLGDGGGLVLELPW